MFRMTWTARDGRTATRDFATLCQAQSELYCTDGIPACDWRQKWDSADLFYSFQGDYYTLTEITEAPVVGDIAEDGTEIVTIMPSGTIITRAMLDADAAEIAAHHARPRTVAHEWFPGVNASSNMFA